MMKLKKLSAVIIFFFITLILYAGATVAFCYTTKPQVATGTFPFSITYEYKGETKTISGYLECEYDGSQTIHGTHERYWDGRTYFNDASTQEGYYLVEQDEELQTSLAIHANMQAGYFMGDPLYEDNGGYDLAPDVEYYDYKNEISLDETNREEVLNSIGFQFVEYTYGEPIENSFSTSGIRYEADNLMIFVAVSLVFLALCLIFVRAENREAYSKLDKAGVILNYIVGFAAIPFITLICFLFGLVESNVAIINQITYNIPAASILCLGFSIALRRKGFSKTGFYFQFGGIALFVLILILDTLL